jgi:hypothetical protein
VKSLRVPVNYGTPTKKILTRVPHRKPDKSWFVRAHPTPDYRDSFGVIELREAAGGIGKELFLVTPPVCAYLAQQEACFAVKLLVTSINRQGVVFLWKTNLPRDDGRPNSWTESGLEAIQRAEKAWVRVTPNIGSGGYDLAEAAIELPEPVWPELTLSELLAISFKGAVIDSLDHSVLKRLRGEV